tara:strand:+ start:1307 stop:1699 length:393 start_codon:yes stop_codon:yes gene_type:complete
MGKSILEVLKTNGHFDENESELTLVGSLNEAIGLPRKLPIKAPKQTWTQTDNPNKLNRNFEFDGPIQLLFFVSEVIAYQEEINHHGKIVIEGQEVNIEVYTHDLNEVTGLDIKYAKEVDLIYKDARHISE